MPINNMNKAFARQSFLPKNLGGFTLIEIIIAVFVLVVGMISVFAIFSFALSNSNTSKNLTFANNTAQEKIEQIISLSYDDIASIARQAHSEQFDWQANVQFMTINNGNLQASETDQGLKKITITIFWQEKGNEKSKSISTLKARY